MRAACNYSLKFGQIYFINCCAALIDRSMAIYCQATCELGPKPVEAPHVDSA